MPLLLTVLDESAQTADPAEQDMRRWETFLASRMHLTDSMELATCDGCDQCGTRCIAGFGVTREEYKAVQEYLAGQNADEVARIAAQAKTVPWPGAEDTGATVTFCRYRDRERNRCSIYPARPTICRLFGHTPWLPCPIEAVSHYPEAASDVWNAYRRFERHTFEEWDKISLEE